MIQIPNLLRIIIKILILQKINYYLLRRIMRIMRIFNYKQFVFSTLQDKKQAYNGRIIGVFCRI